ncbi:MAG: diaminopimelate decarboxylase [Victivallaceae bacterium]|nr:diaminopimelate decarboxylase [Victivallaceae bacterium]
MISDAALLELARRYGTPLFVYDADHAVAQYRALFERIPWPGLEIHYALKANYNPHLALALRDAGAGIDAVSPAEVQYALRLGFPKEKIIYTANNMTDAEFERVCATGVLMNIGSLSRLRKIARDHKGMRVCLRFNPDVCDGDSIHTMTAGALTKFGILLDDVKTVLEIVREGNLHVVGLHEHTGSGLQHAESVYAAMDKLMSIAAPENFPELEMLDFGGGFKVPYRSDEKEIDYFSMGRTIAQKFRDFCDARGKNLKMLFEPGKFLTARAGHLVVEVNTVKRNRDRLIAGCNSGFPQLIRPLLYGAYHRIDNLSNPGGAPFLYDVCGNICETGDRFAEQRELPEIREYDLLAIRNAGAYCYSMGGVYNLRPMPTEVTVSEGKVVGVRKRLSDDALADQIFKECDIVL